MSNTNGRGLYYIRNSVSRRQEPYGTIIGYGIFKSNVTVRTEL